MAHNATEADNFDTNVVLTDDGDDAIAANFNAAPQALADRTKFLKGEIDFLKNSGRAVTDGIKHIATVATLAALKAITAGAGIDGEFRWVEAVEILYRYDKDATNSADEPWFVIPTSGGGRWHAVHSLNKDAANGVPSLDNNVRIRFAQLTNAIREIDTTSIGETDDSGVASSISSTALNTYHDVPTLVISTSSDTAIGDLLLAEAHFHYEVDAGGTLAFVQLLVDGTVVGTLRLAGQDDGLIHAGHIVGAGVGAASGGAKALKLRIRTNGGQILIYQPALIRVTLIKN